MNNTKWWIRNLAHLNVTRESIFPDILKDSTGQQMLKTMLLSQEKTSIRVGIPTIKKIHPFRLGEKYFEQFFMRILKM